MKLKPYSVFFALCVSMMLTYVPPVWAQLQPLEPAAPPWMADMYEQGWRKVADGVLQRSEGEGEPIESFFYNEDGLRWRVQQLQNRLSQFEYLHNTSPSADLTRLITDLESEISALDDRIHSGQAEAFTGEMTANCPINYGANASAGWLTGSSAPGVTATAIAYFNNSCGYQGKAYASVYVQAVKGAVITATTQTTDPPEATAVNASAQFSASGSTSCYSYAVGRAESTALNLLYTVEDDNYSCPQPSFEATIQGPDYFYTDSSHSCASITWFANAWGGTPPYTFKWYLGSTHLGSGIMLRRTYCSNEFVAVQLVATDSTGQTYSTSTCHPYQADPYTHNLMGCSLEVF